MTEAKDNSSLPLLLSITGAVVAVAIGGWFLLNQQSVRQDEGSDPGVAPAAAGIADEATTTIVDENDLNIDTELRKARLAADAEILVLPDSQSALFYYSRVLKVDPQHAVARAERDAVLASVSQAVSQHLAAEEYEEAYEIAVVVAGQVPEHDLVIETQTTLDALTEDLVQRSINSVQRGDDQQADELLATALTLPGRNPRYFSAIRDSIAEIRSVREAASRDRALRAELAADDARKAWVEGTLAAIAAGNLIAPVGASAIDLLAESNSWTAERTQLTSDVLGALLAAARAELDGEELAHAEELLQAATELAGDSDEIIALRAVLESALIEAESSRAVKVSDLVILKSVAPQYPQRAQERNVSGWVDVYFTVTPQGETADIEIVKSEPKRTFDRAAKRAVEQWRFQPVEYRDQIISQRAATRLVFRLE